MRAKQDLALATQGHRLLDQKREVLIIELLQLLTRLREQAKRAREALSRGYEAMEQAEMGMGSEAFRTASMGPGAELELSAVERSVMGVALPTLRVEGEPRGPDGGLAWSVPELDEGIESLRAAVPEIVRWAELHLAVYRLAAEVRKTQRRVNALSEVFIPETTETVRHISSALAEAEREEFFRRKRVKSKLRERDRAGGEAA